MGDCLLWQPSAVSHCIIMYYDVSYLVNKLSLSLSLSLFLVVLRLMRYERISIENQRFRSNTVSLAQNFR